MNVFTTWAVINFPSFKLSPIILWTKNGKLFSSFLGFKVIYQRSRNNELKRYLSRNITNDVCSHPWKPQHVRFSVMVFIVIIGCFSFCIHTRWMAPKKKFFLNVLLNIELSSLKIGKTCCKPEKLIKKYLILLKWLDENQTIDNRIIPPYVSGTLKHSTHMT